MEADRLVGEARKSLQMLTVAMKLKDACSLEEKLTNLDSILKSRDTTLLTKVLIVKVKSKHESYSVGSDSL